MARASNAFVPMTAAAHQPLDARKRSEVMTIVASPLSDSDVHHTRTFFQ